MQRPKSVAELLGENVNPGRGPLSELKIEVGVSMRIQLVGPQICLP